MKRGEVAALRLRIDAPDVDVETLHVACETLLGEVARQRAVMIEVAIPLALLQLRFAFDKVGGVGSDLEESLVQAADLLRQEVG